METIVIRYGELGLKGKNRNVFEKALVREIKERSSHLEDIKIQRFHGRMYVDYHDYDYEEISDVLTHTFGIVSISPVGKCSLEFEDICKEAERQILELIEERKNSPSK